MFIHAKWRGPISIQPRLHWNPLLIPKPRQLLARSCSKCSKTACRWWGWGRWRINDLNVLTVFVLWFSGQDNWLVCKSKWMVSKFSARPDAVTGSHLHIHIWNQQGAMQAQLQAEIVFVCKILLFQRWITKSGVPFPLSFRTVHCNAHGLREQFHTEIIFPYNTNKINPRHGSCFPN